MKNIKKKLQKMLNDGCSINAINNKFNLNYVTLTTFCKKIRNSIKQDS